MIVDSSALVAILLDEPDAANLLKALYAASSRVIAAPNWVETALVFDGRATPETYTRLDRIVAALDISITSFSAEMAQASREANRRYGKGSKHPARLNYGDCMAYALAKVTGEPLLFKGNDFIHTDITPALA